MEARNSAPQPALPPIISIVGRATAVATSGGPPADCTARLMSLMFSAEVLRALGCTLKTTAFPAERIAIELLMIVDVGFVVGVIEAMKHSLIPATINYRTPDPECDLDYVPNEPRPKEINVCLKDSFGLGGQNCCLVLSKYRE